jgi:hypothetical protein
MKRIRLLILVSTIAVALAVPVVAKATGSSGTTNSVTIQEHADYDAAGFVLDVGLRVRCVGGPGAVVFVDVEQFPPETAVPVSHGVGPQGGIVCDGMTHTVGVTILGEGFDEGRAKATATLVPPPGNGSPVTAVRWITIVVV